MTTTSKPTLVVEAAIEKDCQFLLVRRPKQNHLAGSWEFPGGKVEYGESPEEALCREIKEELGLDIAVQELISVSSHVFPEKHIIMVAYRCKITGGKLVLNEHDGEQWVKQSEFDRIKLTPGTAAAAALLKH